MPAKSLFIRVRLAAVLPTLLVIAPGVAGAQALPATAGPIRLVPDSTRADASALAAVLSDTVVARCVIGVGAGAEFGDSELAAARACAFERIARRVQARLAVAEPVRWDSTARAFVTRNADRETTLPASLRFGVAGGELRAHAVLGVPTHLERPTAVVEAKATASTNAPPAIPSPAATELPNPEHPHRKPSNAVPTLPAVPSATPGKPITVAPGRPDATLERPVAKDSVRPERVRRDPISMVPVPSSNAPAPAPVRVAFRVTGPATVRAIIGRKMPIAMIFTLTDSVSGSRLTRGLAGACVVRRGGDDVKVAAEMSTDGRLACSVALGEDATIRETYVVEALFKTDGNRTVGHRIAVSPIDAPSYAVRATAAECKALEARVTFLLQQRGVPVVTTRKADRVAALSSCQPFDRVLPAKSWTVAPSGVLVLGEITEKGADPFDAPGRTGGFAIESTKPGTDPLAEAAEQVVQKLLKYIAL